MVGLRRVALGPNHRGWLAPCMMLPRRPPMLVPRCPVAPAQPSSPPCRCLHKRSTIFTLAYAPSKITRRMRAQLCCFGGIRTPQAML